MKSVKYLSFPRKNIELEIILPASKSISNRVLILNALSYSPYEIENLSDCDDTRVMVDAFDSNSTHFDVGAAGTSMRFLTAFLAKTVGEWTITGSERMKNRPIKVLVDALNLLGGRVEYMEKEGFPPLRIFGSALMGGEISLDGGISSQYISALMMIAPYMQNGLKINLKGKIISKPYIEMTRRMMADFGVKVDFRGNRIDIKPQTYQPIRYRVESDWSAASYWYEMLTFAEGGKIKLNGLMKNSLQGDSQVAEIYRDFGIKTEYFDNYIVITKSTTSGFELSTSALEIDFTDIPDLAQTVVVTCCMKDIPFRFSGLQSLKIKETNRITALINELKKLGFLLHEPAEGQLAWSGEKCESEKTPSIATYEDHRMAMAFTPVALIRPVEIQHPEVVTKSYPRFWEDINQLNG
ncbi:MAG: 3-phosphoshikimate 1-carboxyvinyltransferase [Bacteroidales bacterium]|nr:3-phosphoshikimate 1-carboxyvinyltransferase [Bacteroidales bacterium]